MSNALNRRVSRRQSQPFILCHLDPGFSAALTVAGMHAQSSDHRKWVLSEQWRVYIVDVSADKAEVVVVSWFDISNKKVKHLLVDFLAIVGESTIGRLLIRGELLIHDVF